MPCKKKQSKHYNLFLFVIFASFLLVAPAHAATKKNLNILFIGNSYTYYNNFPALLTNLINKSKKSPVTVNIQIVVNGGYDFLDHWNNGRALRTIKSNGILQERQRR